MFIHPNFPAQFGQIAAYLSTKLRWPCTVVTSIDTTHLTLPFTHINYKVREGPQPKVFYNPPSYQDHLDHMGAIYRGLRGQPLIRPDLVVGHTFYGTMLYLRNLYRCPFVGYYELLPPPFWSDAMAVRKDYPPTEGQRLANATLHTCTYLHLHAVDSAYTPTHYQLTTAPPDLQHKIRVIFDGVDCDYFRRRPAPRPLTVQGRTYGPETRVVTYCSRGLESIRGFDIFMQTAKRIYQQLDNVVFLIAGQDKTFYGHELGHIGQQSFKDYVLSKDKYDLERFHFLGLIPTDQLVGLFSASDLHFYLTVPYILSWSMMQAMATGCTILGSATAPVQEVIQHGVNGLLADFYDPDALAEQAVKVLRDPGQHRPLGEAARATILEKYELKHCTDQLVSLFQSLAGSTRP
jgi:glycosyltransferase involved in cell wall biosynthesis